MWVWGDVGMMLEAYVTTAATAHIPGAFARKAWAEDALFVPEIVPPGDLLGLCCSASVV